MPIFVEIRSWKQQRTTEFDGSATLKQPTEVLAGYFLKWIRRRIGGVVGKIFTAQIAATEQSRKNR
jgi:hypothetical protein